VRLCAALHHGAASSLPTTDAVERLVLFWLVVDAGPVPLVADDGLAVLDSDPLVSDPHSITGLQLPPTTTVMHPGARHSR
jgi:hypothetical protein